MKEDVNSKTIILDEINILSPLDISSSQKHEKTVALQEEREDIGPADIYRVLYPS